MTPMFWLALIGTVIILLYPAGFLAGYARGRNTKVLTIVAAYLRGEDNDAPGDPEAP